ncbi:hypothetical protein [Ornithinibacillus californiensis]|uniref:hypothetical protein n=1 Tax=Ornithinibacillus californiensis TaxID=161536 RepID=UPI001F249760|nr:hypothetical protein [Ornithinibacillus californiensis]
MSGISNSTLKTHKFSALLILIILFVGGCSPGHGEGGALSKKQVLKLYPDADLFEFDGYVYKTGVDWIEDEELTKDEQIGVISEGMANKLPVGSKIFSVKEKKPILIVEYNGLEKRYLIQLGE